VAVPSWYKSARGSGGGYFRDQALALQAAGWRVAMLAPDLYTPRDLRRGEVAPGRGRNVRVEDDGVPTWRRDALMLVPRLPYRNAAVFAWCGLKLLARYVAANGLPDLVQAHGALNAGVAAWAIRRRWGIPYVLTEHSTAFAQGRLRSWERDLVRRVIEGARHCVAVSPQLAALLAEQYPESRWQYLPNPLGEAFLAADAAAARRETGEPFVFVSVARLSPEKGHARLIEAFSEAFGGDPGIRLRLAGEGPMRAELERLCAARGVAGQIDFLGLLPSATVRNELAAADAFVLASDVETFGVAVIEALACGRPVIVTASGGPDHLVTAANGMLIPPRDPAALRDALIRMRQEAGDYDRMAIRAEARRPTARSVCASVSSRDRRLTGRRSAPTGEALVQRFVETIDESEGRRLEPPREARLCCRKISAPGCGSGSARVCARSYSGSVASFSRAAGNGPESRPICRFQRSESEVIAPHRQALIAS
jgi:glycosyltransferase involved in cell wall biosynthesis